MNLSSIASDIIRINSTLDAVDNSDTLEVPNVHFSAFLSGALVIMQGHYESMQAQGYAFDPEVSDDIDNCLEDLLGRQVLNTNDIMDDILLLN